MESKSSDCGEKATNLQVGLCTRICVFCRSSDQDEENLGKFQFDEAKGIGLHQYCLLFASGLAQNGEDDEGFDGFLFNDIKAEVKRAGRLRCSFCRIKGASIGCVTPKCPKKFHFNCAKDKQALFHFFGNFNSYCRDHRPTQQLSKSCIGVSIQTCPICLMSVSPQDDLETIKSPCCKNAWFHRICIQKQAMACGLHFFRCAVCNNIDTFQDEMKRMGINIPDRDAIWEKDDAYADLLHEYNRCDATHCICQKGRDFSGRHGKWKIRRCDFCGQCGTHMHCQGWSSMPEEWHCPTCSGIERRTRQERITSPQNTAVTRHQSTIDHSQNSRSHNRSFDSEDEIPLHEIISTTQNQTISSRTSLSHSSTESENQTTCGLSVVAVDAQTPKERGRPSKKAECSPACTETEIQTTCGRSVDPVDAQTPQKRRPPTMDAECSPASTESQTSCSRSVVSVNTQTPKKRGRSSKRNECSPDATTESQTSCSRSVVSVDTQTPKKRGRPPKKNTCSPASTECENHTICSQSMVSVGAQTQTKRGRPSKKNECSPASTESETQTISSRSVISVDTHTPTKRGRPSKKNECSPASTESEMQTICSRSVVSVDTQTPKKRGRPTKKYQCSPSSSESGSQSSRSMDCDDTKTPRKRGRPPKKARKESEKKALQISPKVATGKKRKRIHYWSDSEYNPSTESESEEDNFHSSIKQWTKKKVLNQTPRKRFWESGSESDSLPNSLPNNYRMVTDRSSEITTEKADDMSLDGGNTSKKAGETGQVAKKRKLDERPVESSHLPEPVAERIVKATEKPPSKAQSESNTNAQTVQIDSSSDSDDLQITSFKKGDGMFSRKVIYRTRCEVPHERWCECYSGNHHDRRLLSKGKSPEGKGATQLGNVIVLDGDSEDEPESSRCGKASTGEGGMGLDKRTRLLDLDGNNKGDGDPSGKESDHAHMVDMEISGTPGGESNDERESIGSGSTCSMDSGLGEENIDKNEVTDGKDAENVTQSEITCEEGISPSEHSIYKTGGNTSEDPKDKDRPRLKNPSTSSNVGSSSDDKPGSNDGRSDDNHTGPNAGDLGNRRDPEVCLITNIKEESESDYDPTYGLPNSECLRKFVGPCYLRNVEERSSHSYVKNSFFRCTDIVDIDSEEDFEPVKKKKQQQIARKTVDRPTSTISLPMKKRQTARKSAGSPTSTISAPVENNAQQPSIKTFFDRTNTISVHVRKNTEHTDSKIMGRPTSPITLPVRKKKKQRTASETVDRPTSTTSRGVQSVKKEQQHTARETCDRPTSMTSKDVQSVKKKKQQADSEILDRPTSTTSKGVQSVKKKRQHIARGTVDMPESTISKDVQSVKKKKQHPASETVDRPTNTISVPVKKKKQHTANKTVGKPTSTICKDGQIANKTKQQTARQAVQGRPTSASSNGSVKNMAKKKSKKARRTLIENGKLGKSILENSLMMFNTLHQQKSKIEHKCVCL